MSKRIPNFAAFACVTAALVLTACGSGSFRAEDPDPRSPSGPARNPNIEVDSANRETVFGTGGVSLNEIVSGDAFRDGDGPDGGSLPVNKFLWQASLDTLSFMPLNSTDPFTGVIATDWSSPPSTPGERLKVTVRIDSPELSASSLRVAVFREIRTETGWQPATVARDTPRKIEDAILTRARQIRIADRDGTSTTG